MVGAGMREGKPMEPIRVTRRHFLQLAGGTALTLALPSGLFAAETDAKKEPFTIIALPDTQNYLRYGAKGKLFLGQTEWIKKNAKKLSIRFVLHEGDITNSNTPEEWKIARKCMAQLDGVVPYGLCVGNHDFGYSGSAGSPICQYFKPEDYKKHKWWGGQMPKQDCFYYTMKVADQPFLMLSLDFGATDSQLAWADTIVKKHAKHAVIMVTHSYLHDDGTTSDKKDMKNASHYGRHANGERRNTGEDIWRKHVRKHKNYLMVLSGHNRGPASRLTSKGKEGNTVHQMMANYQYEAKGGNGYLRILRFDPAKKTLTVSTYSPNLNKFWKDDANAFKLPLTL